MTTPITQRLAEISSACQFDQLPGDVITIAKMSILDNLGCALRGVSEPVSQLLGRELLERDVSARDLIPGSQPAIKPSDRALLHGVAAHAIDFDDTFIPGKSSHIGNSVVGAALSLVNECDVSGPELLVAVVAGYEVAARVGALLDDDHYLKGFHPTCTVGVFAAAVTAAHLLKLDGQQACAALGLAATQAAGLKCTFGTMAKPFNAGNAAASGVLAARLVARGFSAPINALEADKGYLQLYMGLEASRRQVEELQAYRIRENLFKYYAACHATHPLIEAIKLLQAQHGFTDDEVRALKVKVSNLSLKTASIVTPKSGLECKFSFNQVGASVLAGRNMAADESYSDAVLEDARVNSLRELTEVTVDPALVPAQTGIHLELSDGRSLQLDFDGRDTLADLPSQLPGMKSKFMANSSSALGSAAAERLLAGIVELDQATLARETFCGN